jgi:PadR family transcriptional regulator PadR
MAEPVARSSIILRGVLDLCLLALLEKRVVYGYELAQRLAEHGLPVAGGSTYPLLARLERAGLVQAETRRSDQGPARKYYSLTPAGISALRDGREEWRSVAAAVGSVLEEPVTEAVPAAATSRDGQATTRANKES